MIDYHVSHILVAAILVQRFSVDRAQSPLQVLEIQMVLPDLILVLDEKLNDYWLLVVGLIKEISEPDHSHVEVLEPIECHDQVRLVVHFTNLFVFLLTNFAFNHLFYQFLKFLLYSLVF